MRSPRGLLRPCHWALALALGATLGCGGDGGVSAGGQGGHAGAGGLGGAGGRAGASGTVPDGIVVDTPSGLPASESADGHCDIL